MPKTAASFESECARFVDAKVLGITIVAVFAPALTFGTNSVIERRFYQTDQVESSSNPKLRRLFQLLIVIIHLNATMYFRANHADCWPITGSV